MGLHDPFEYLNITYGQKKGREWKCHFDFQPLKVKNLPNLLACMWLATYCWKALDMGYNFALDLISTGGLRIKLWASKVVRVPISKISGLQLGSPRTKWHLNVGPMAKHKEYYKGEGGGFLQVRAMVSLVNPCLPVARPCTKSALAMH
jgi:hypothetical protein